MSVFKETMGGFFHPVDSEIRERRKAVNSQRPDPNRVVAQGITQRRMDEFFEECREIAGHRRGAQGETACLACGKKMTFSIAEMYGRVSVRCVDEDCLHERSFLASAYARP